MSDKQKSEAELKAEAEAKAKAEAEAKAKAEAEKAKAEGPKTAVTLRHKTQYPKYRRAGLMLTQTPATYEVTAEQLAVLKKDKWVEVVEAKA